MNYDKFSPAILIPDLPLHQPFRKYVGLKVWLVKLWKYYSNQLLSVKFGRYPGAGSFEISYRKSPWIWPRSNLNSFKDLVRLFICSFVLCITLIIMACYCLLDQFCNIANNLRQLWVDPKSFAKLKNLIFLCHIVAQVTAD